MAAWVGGRSTLAFLEERREVPLFKFLASREDRGAFDDVLQLADIARPMMVFQNFER